MNVVIFGATGMVGQGVLRECLIDPTVTRVVTVGRSATGTSNPRLKEIVHSDLFNLEPIAGELTDLDACFFCLGITSVGMNETDYTRITYRPDDGGRRHARADVATDDVRVHVRRGR